MLVYKEELLFTIELSKLQKIQPVDVDIITGWRLA